MAKNLAIYSLIKVIKRVFILEHVAYQSNLRFACGMHSIILKITEFCKYLSTLWKGHCKSYGTQLVYRHTPQTFVIPRQFLFESQDHSRCIHNPLEV